MVILSFGTNAMSLNPEQDNNPEKSNDEALPRYTDRGSVFDDLMGMDEVPSVPAKSEARSGKNSSSNGKSTKEADSDAETVVYDYDFIQSKLEEAGLNIDDGFGGETEAILPIKDTEGFHIAIMVPGQRILPFLWPEGAESITVGRDKTQADIHVNDHQVSRIHLQIKRVDDNTVEVMDLGSTNHSYMSQDALNPYTLIPWEFGEVIVVGRTRLILRRGIPHT